MSDNKTLCSVVAEAIAEKGLSDRRVADAAGLSNATVSRITNPKDNIKPTPRTIEKIAKVLNLDYNYLLQLIGYVKTPIETPSETAYVLTADGYTRDHGAEIFLLGVFTDKKEAKEEAKKQNCRITEIPMNRMFQLKDQGSAWFPGYSMANDYYLGGYFE